MNLHHNNKGHCYKCDEIFDKYPGFDSDIRGWFETLRQTHGEFHISCAGRGRIDQEHFFLKKASRAHYGQSAHNWNCAIDTFINLPGLDLYDPDHYQHIFGPQVPSWLNWYGIPGHDYYELPHLEKRDWLELKNKGKLNLVE